jgi:hypothetical protein
MEVLELAKSLKEAVEKQLEQLEENEARAKREFEERAKRVAEDRQQLEAEKAAMAALIKQKPSELVYLNVGGEHITTSRETLCAVEPSLLASMFSGRWEDAMTLDKDGRVFFDFNPRHFRRVLDYLRTLKLGRTDAPLPCVDDAIAFHAMLEYLGLERLLPPVPQRFYHSPGSLSVDQGTLTNVQSGHHYAISAEPLSPGCSWMVDLTGFKTWVFCGVIANQTPTSEASYSDATSYGWACSNQVYVGGANKAGMDNWTSFEVGQRAKLTFTGTHVHVQVIGSQSHVLHLPFAHEWYMHFNLHGAGDVIRVTPA